MNIRVMFILPVMMLWSFAATTMPAIERPDGLSKNQWLLAQSVVDYLGVSQDDLITETTRLQKIQRGKIVGGWDGAYSVDPSGEYIIYDGQRTGRSTQDSLMKRQQKVVDDIKSRILLLKSGKVVYPDLVIDQLKKGKIGRIKTSDGEVKPSYTPTVAVSRVISPDEMVVKYGDLSIWLKGLSTDGVVDDAKIQLNGPYIVSGTHTSGRTLFVLEPIDEAGVQKAVEYLRYQKSNPPMVKK